MINCVGIIGAGQMGTGIAQVMLQAGIAACLNDISQEQLDSSRKRISRGLAKVGHESAIENLTTGIDFGKLHSCDLVIEAASEDESLKGHILQDLCQSLSPNALLATNTSSLSITRLAAVTDRPEKFIGMHFMNPAEVMSLVEIIRGAATSDETFRSICDLASKIGKEYAVSADTPGFIVNRLLIPMLNESITALHERVADVADIDKAMTLGANFPMGPLALADLIGLDTCLAIMKVLHDEIGGDKYRPAILLGQFVQKGWLGRKSGIGFYDYSKGKPIPRQYELLVASI